MKKSHLSKISRHERLFPTPSCRTRFLHDSARCGIHDIIVVMGDPYAKVGSNNINREVVPGKFGVGVMNDNGERLCGVCGTNRLAMTGTVFPHKEILKLPWNSPDGNTANQIDHVLMNGRMRASFWT